MGSLDLKVLQALNEDKSNKKGKKQRKKFQITKGAYEKAMLYAKIASRLAGGGMECYGYLVKPKESLDDIVTDVYFAHEQEASSGHVMVEAEGIRRAVEEVYGGGYEIVGWWHSHGTIGTFHSGTDVENFEKILHSVAPRTMFRNEIALYNYNEETQELEFDNYRIKGVKPVNPSILKKVKRDPFAFSFVVNVRREHYLECITKTYDDEEKKFKLNKPYHPQLDIIDSGNDVEFTVSQIEQDIRNKLVFNGYHHRTVFEELEEDKTYSKYRRFVRRFIYSAQGYLEREGKNLELIHNLLTSYRQSYDMLRESREGQITDEQIESVLEHISKNRKDIIEKLDSELNTTNPKRFLNPNNKFTKQELEKLILFRFIYEFAKKDEWCSSFRSREQDKIASKYRKRIKVLDECYGIAQKAANAMVEYSIATFERYDGKPAAKYEGLMTKILANTADEDNFTFIDSVKNETSRPLKPARALFLQKERKNITDQLTKDLYYSMTGKCKSQFNEHMFCFLTEFPQVYKKSQKADKLIEDYLLPMKPKQPGYVPQAENSTRHSILYSIRKKISDILGRH
ncbi:Mov34/MPN/PAD-1 family protein [Candidatus Woesearchaeota archaeon]|nr:Mov34/MPN/PAD-1 family protein [Candidatus Woesearchaeota archaeon]